MGIFKRRYKCCQPLFCSVLCGRNLQGRGAFLRYGIPMPSGRNVIASLAFFMPLRDADSHPRKPKENVPPHPIPELPEGPKSPLYFTALAQYGPDVPAARFCAAGRPFLGRGAGERPHAARSGAAGVIRLSERHIQSRIPDAAGRHCAGSGP